MIELTDPKGGRTRFGIRQSDFATVYVSFSTPRGWHERRYSNFFHADDSVSVQAGRVRLFYDDVKANEAIWTRVEVDPKIDPAVFTVAKPPDTPTI